MRLAQNIMAIIAAVGLTACASTPDYIYVDQETDVTRAAVDDTPILGTFSDENGPVPSFSVAQLNVVVPRSLEVSEANSFRPGGDIVWRGDPFGDRYEQIEAIFNAGMGQGVTELTGDRAVIVDIVVGRFHSVTERTRYTVGGVHSIRFDITVRDAETGEVIEPTRTVKADLEAYGGITAVRAEAAGQTQKVRVTEHLRRVIIYELTRPRDFLRT
jgi:hypothetical protein